VLPACLSRRVGPDASGTDRSARLECRSVASSLAIATRSTYVNVQAEQAREIGSRSNRSVLYRIEYMKVTLLQAGTGVPLTV
jgi:hypothetical protein